MPKKDKNPINIDNQVDDLKKSMKILRKEGKPPKVKKARGKGKQV